MQCHRALLVSISLRIITSLTRSPFKSRFKKKLMENPFYKLDQPVFTEKVIEVGNSFTAEETRNLLRSSHAYMHHMLLKSRPADTQAEQSQPPN